MTAERAREIQIWIPCDQTMPIAGGYLQTADLARRIDELDEICRLKRERFARLGVRVEREPHRGGGDDTRVAHVTWLAARASFHALEAEQLLEESLRIARGRAAAILKAELEYWRGVACMNNALYLSHSFEVNERRLGRYKGGDKMASERVRRNTRIMQIGQALLAAGSPRRGLAKRIRFEWKFHGWKRTDGAAPSERTINDHLTAQGL